MSNNDKYKKILKTIHIKNESRNYYVIDCKI